MVTDASVWVGILVTQDLHHAASRRWLSHRIAGGDVLITPTLALVEVAGAVARRTGDLALGRATTNIIVTTPGMRLVGLDSEAAVEAARLAATLSLRGADAVYVALAATLGVPLATWDQEVRRRAAGVVPVVIPQAPMS